MAPSYWHGQIVVAKRAKHPRIGDVVIVKHHKVEHIKRVSDLNEDEVFLLGDNPNESTDSREYGWVPKDSILGVVIGGHRKQ
jgi:type IV secretory pathway protease TraF